MFRNRWSLWAMSISKLRKFSSADNGPAHVKTVIGNLIGKCSDSPFIKSKVHDLCISYSNLNVEDRRDVLKYISKKHDYEKEKISEMTIKHPTLKGKGILNKWMEVEKHKHALSPEYSELFNLILRMDGGLKFLVDMRADLLDMLQVLQVDDPSGSSVRSFSIGLRETLLFSFDICFLNLVRVTWDSSSELLLKICLYEAVHAVKSWTDIKRRVGCYRRCYVFTHGSMGNEPLVILHTALTDEISSNINAIISDRYLSPENGSLNCLVEDPLKIQAAVFYSISSTQKGLRGIDLGNQIIKQTVGEILKEFPYLQKFSTLSPIPGFRQWLLMQIKKGNSVVFSCFTDEELRLLKKIVCCHKHSELGSTFHNLIQTNWWIRESELRRLLRIPLLKMCAYYLYNEKRRSCAYDSVANFHLRNGAVMWRLNWDADPSPNGLRNSCGIMINYRYFLDETEKNSKNYLENYSVAASDEFKQLLTFSHQSCL